MFIGSNNKINIKRKEDMKKAFTLAEVLITLGIVGTIAALTMPALVKHSGAAEVGPKLAKFDNTVNNAIQELLVDQGVDNVRSLRGDFMELLSQHVIMSPNMDSNKTYTVVCTHNGTETLNNVWITKDGAIVAYVPSQNFEPVTNKGAFRGIVGSLFYDIDGFKTNHNGENVAGDDVFRFDVDNSGVLVPYGSNVDNYIHDFEDGNRVYGDGLNSKKFAKTGEIADNGWKLE